VYVSIHFGSTGYIGEVGITYTSSGAVSDQANVGGACLRQNSINKLIQQDRIVGRSKAVPIEGIQEFPVVSVGVKKLLKLCPSISGGQKTVYHDDWILTGIACHHSHRQFLTVGLG
jgi:hypothetical protein